MLKRLGFVDIDRVWKWCEEIEFFMGAETWNGRVNASGRMCTWFGKGVSLGMKCEVYRGLDIGSRLKLKGDRLWGEGWNSLLVYKYGSGCELKSHVDRKIFDRKVVIVNVCKELVDFQYGSEVYQLKDGEIIEIDGGIKHGVLPVNGIRYSLSFRKVI